MPYGDDMDPAAPTGAPGFGLDPSTLAAANGAPPIADASPPPGLPFWATPDMLQQLSAAGFTPARAPSSSGPAVPPGQLSPGQEAQPPALPDWISPEAAAHYGLTPIGAAPAPATGGIVDPIAHGIREAAHAAGLLADVPGDMISGVAARGQQQRQAAQDEAFAASPLGHQIADYRQLGETALKQGDLESELATKNAAFLDEANRKRADAEAAYQITAAAQKQDEANTYKRFNDDLEVARNFKVDPNRKWHSLGTGGKIAAGIGVVLSGLGQAIAGNGQAPNAAIKIIQDSIKEDVEQQYKDREAKQWQVGADRGAIDVARSATGDARLTRDLAIASATRDAADQMMATAQRYNSPQAKLRAQQAAQTLHLQADQLVGNAAAQQSAQRAAERAALLKQMNEDADRKIKQQEANTGSQNAYTTARGEKREELKDVVAANIDYAKLQQEAAKADIADKKERDAATRAAGDLAVGVQPTGVGDDGKPKYTPLYAVNKSEAERLAPKFNAAQDAAKKFHQLKKLKEEFGGEAMNGPAAQRMKSLYGDIIADKMEFRGYKRYSKETEEAVNAAMGDGDITSFRRDILPGLEQGIKGMHDELSDQLPGYQAPTDPDDAAASPVSQVLGPQTATEAGAAAEPGVLGKVAGGISKDADALAYPLGHSAGRDNVGTAAENTGNAVGLQPEAAQGVSKLVTAASSAGAGAKAAKESLLKLITDPARPTVGPAVLSSISSSNPELYKELVAALPKDQRKTRLQFDAATLSVMPASGLAEAARYGNEDAQRELATRVVNGNAEAQMELSDLLTSRSSR